MNIDFSTDRMIIVHFPSYSGGKFIINCLALSKHAVPQHTEVATHLLNKPTDYDYRLNAVLSTLPSSDDMKEWLSWEFGDSHLWGAVDECLHNWKHCKPNNKVDKLLSNLVNNKICVFITSHWEGDIKDIVDVWGNAQIICLTNSKKFWEIAVNLKHTNTTDRNLLQHSDSAGNECKDTYLLLKGPNWPNWELFEECHYNIDKVSKKIKIKKSVKEEIQNFYPWHTIKNNIFNLDVDTNFFDKQRFLTTMHNLYEWLGFDDYNLTLIEQYYQKYMAIHVDNNDNI